jgi:hypothetical protein
MSGAEGSTPAPQEPQHEGFFARIFKRSHEGSGVVGLDPSAQAELEAARQPQPTPSSEVTQPVAEVSTPTDREKLLASADGRGWAGHKDTEKYGPMPGAPAAVETPATTAEIPQADTENPDELREAA